MDDVSNFYTKTLNNGRNFSWVFLVNWILTVVLISSVTFYLGRSLAYFISFLLEWVLWKHAKIKINFQSFRISFLGGRIFFKNLTIIDKDYTISFLEGTVTWRYWLYRTRNPQFIEEIIQKYNVEDNILKQNETLPCRFVLECEGLEIFIYNKTIAFDNILNKLPKNERLKFEQYLNNKVFKNSNNQNNINNDGINKDSNKSYSSSDSSTSSELNNKFNHGIASSEETESYSSESSTSNNYPINDRIFQEQESKNDTVLQLFPFEIKVNHTAVVIGNKFTPYLMILSADNAKGILDYSQANSKLDLYKNKCTLDCKNFNMSLRQNIGYNKDDTLKFKIDKGRVSKVWKKFIKLSGNILTPLNKSRHNKKPLDSNIIFQEKWKGLSIYRENMFAMDNNDIDDVEFNFAAHEYAKFTNIVKCPRIIFTYSFDIPGSVPHGAHPITDKKNGPDIGNSGSPPAFELNIELYGGSICYGPWAQRQVEYIKTLFSPVLSRSQKPTQILKPGDKRMSTQFKISFNVIEETTWRIPTRESSKDAEFLKRYRETNDDYRPFGWLDLKFSPNSSALFSIDLCTTQLGSSNVINIQLEDTEIRTSVNHDVFMKAKLLNFDISLLYPLGWNEKAIWTIDALSSQLETFILREHVTLIADIISDFGSGEPTPYELFRPFTYIINWEIRGYSIYLNVNDHNIVNNPLDFNENCYLSFHGDNLYIDISTSNDSIGQRSSNIIYSIRTPMFRLLLNSPPWNTLNEFMKQKEVGRSYCFKAEGNYLIYNDLDVDNVDMVTIECTSKNTLLYCYGFVIRYLINVKMNYFGDFFHFVTTEEYTGEINTKSANELQHLQEDIRDSKSFSTKSSISTNDKSQTLSPNDMKRTTNETDLWLTFSVLDGALILPETIYNCDPVIAWHFSELMIDVRSSNYYMDLLTSIDDIHFRRYISKQAHNIFDIVKDNNGNDIKQEGYISNLAIHGHRMYGLPPSEPTYFCKWDFDLGEFVIDSNINFVKGFVTSFQKIGFGFTDLENVLLYETDVVDDMTSLTVNIKQILITICEPKSKAKLFINIDGFNFGRIDFENENYSTRFDIKLPQIHISLTGMDENKHEISYFEFETQVNFSNFYKARDLNNHREVQIDYITKNDAPFHRCPFLLPEDKQNSAIYRSLHGSIVPSSSLPPLPIPIVEQTIKFVLENFLGDEECWKAHDPIFNKHLTENFKLQDKLSQHIKDLDPLEHSIFFQKDEENCDCDNYVLDIKYVSIVVNPEVHSFVEGFLVDFYNDDIEQIMDSIEIGIVKTLSKLQEGISTINNIKFRILSLDLFWGKRQSGGIELYLDSIDFEMNEKSIEKDREKILAEIAVLLKMKSIRATINSKYDGGIKEELPPALSFMIEDLNFWSTMKEKQVNSINVASMDITIDETQIVWLFTFFSIQKEYIEKVITTFEDVQKKRSASRKEVISRVTAAGDYYQISHDPYVITKPAFITRLSRGHVRENRSWKIITRLRHIITYLPENWNSVVTKHLHKRKFDLSQDAKNIFMSVFSTWRNWEFSDIARSYIYGKLFLVNQSDKQRKIIQKFTRLDLASLYVTVYTAGKGVDHNFIVTNSNLIVEKTPPLTVSGVTREKVINITANLGNIKGKISDKMFKIKSLIALLKEEEEPALKRINTIRKSFKINIAAIFESCDLLFVFGKTELSLLISSGKISALLETPKESVRQGGSAILFADRAELSLQHNHKLLLETQITSLSTIFVAESLNYKPNILSNTQYNDIHIRIMPETDTVIQFIKDIKNKIDDVKENFHFTKKHNKAITRTEKAYSLINADITCIFSNISIELMPLSPFQYRQETKRLEVSFNSQRTQSFEITIQESDLYLGSHLTKQQYLRLSLGSVNLKGSSSLTPNIVINTEIVASVVKLTLSEPHRLLISFLQDERVASLSLKKLLALKTFLAPSSKSLSVDKSKPASRIQWSSDINVQYYGILIPISTTFFVLEVHQLLMSLSDTGLNEAGNNSKELSGHLSIENILVFIKDRVIPSSLSKMVDLSLKLSTIQKPFETQQSYQIESPHFRICMSPYLLVRLLWGGNQLMALYQHYTTHHPKNLWNFLSSTDIHSSNANSHSILSSLKLSSCHILSYNFCIGWLFHKNNHETNPGLIIGYNRLFSAFENGCGKLTVVDAFFAVANGNTSDNFYSDGTEKSTFNRSFLPNLQIVYWLKNAGKLKDIFIRLHGESLDVNFLNTFINVIESTLQSIQVFQDLNKLLVHPLNSHINDSTNNGVKNKSNVKDIAPFLSNIRKINCQIKYDGGVFKIYSADDATSTFEPSLEFKSPGVTINIDYKIDEQNTKPHWIRTLIKIEPTHNILYSRCAPLLNKFSTDIQDMVRRHSSKGKPTSKAQSLKSSSQTIDYRKLLYAFDIFFEIQSSEQKLSLSCEPKAKVQADIGFDFLNFSINTNNLDTSEPLGFSLILRKIQASIKHIFSREISSSFNLDLIDLTFLFTKPNIVNMFATSLISDLDAYLNVKQLQNLYLFLDIWQFGEMLRSKPLNIPDVTTPTGSMLSLQPVNHSGSLIPWCFTLILSNIRGRIDLGPSLGILSLNLKKIWLASDHYENKRQLLHIFADVVKLESVGRLSGIFEVTGAFWIAEVNWSSITRISKHPLVAISFNIDNIKIKAAFDYHIFLIGTIDNTKIHLHSERDKLGNRPDLLVVTLSCNTINLCSTALVASNLLDIYNTIMRMKQDTNISYLETLRESDTAEPKKEINYRDILRVLNLIQTDVSVDIKTFNVQISPISLFDIEVVVIKIESILASVKTLSGEKVATYLDLHILNAKGSLSTSKKEMDEETVSSISVEDYMQYASEIKGGTIIDIPRLQVSMHTWQSHNSDILEYKYTSTFGDKIAVRWNLGPINFIKAMWATHVRALAVRRSQNIGNFTEESEDNVEKRIKEEENLLKLIYIAIEEPRIDMPQIKDLGDATPPLEWFGLNRKRFPLFTHQLVVVPIQKLIHSAEKEYASIIGHSE